MHHSAPIMAQSTDELVYIIAVLIMIGIGWASERIKERMAGNERKVPPRPGRRPPTSLPRPPIQSMPEMREPPDRRPSVPPAAPRPRPPVRPPGARPSEPEEGRRTASPPRPAGRPRPAVSPTAEEARTIIRGEPAAQRTPPTSPWEAAAPVRPQPAAPQLSTQPAPAARLAQWGQQVQAEADARQVGQMKPAEAIEAAVVRGRVGAGSFRNLTRADLQRAFVLKEILEPPLALRDE